MATVTQTAYDRVLQAARDRGLGVRENRDGDAHVQCGDERTPSLHVTDRGEGRVVLYCFRCDEGDQQALAAQLGLTEADLFDGDRVTYSYPDGRVVHRFPGKRFSQSGNTKGDALYRRDRVEAAVAAGQRIYVVEGEADVHAVERAGGVATCSPMGAGKWRRVDPSPLYGAQVVVVQDRDDAGRQHAAQVIESLRGKATVELREARTGKDACDHLMAGHGLDDLVRVDLPEPLGRRARITWASEIEPEPVEWAWRDDGHGRIPSKAITLAAGREGTGKSSFGIWMAAQVSRGTLPGAFQGTPHRVLYVAVEDSWEQTIAPRLMAADADLSMVGRFDVIEQGEEVALSLPADNRLLEETVVEHDVAMVVVDPLMSAMGRGIDTHIEREVRQALEPLAAMARRTGVALLGIAHFNKGSGTDLNNLITGSGAFKNVARAVLGFAHDDDGGVMSQTKNSLGRGDLPSLGYVLESHVIHIRKGRAETARFRFTGQADRTVRDVLRDSRADPEEQTERAEVESWLRDYGEACGGEAKAADVIRDGEKEGFRADRIKKSRARVKVQTKRVGFGKDAHYVWTWPSHGSPMDAMDAENLPPASMASMTPSMPPEPDANGQCWPPCPRCGNPMFGTGREVCGRCNSTPIRTKEGSA